MPGSTAVRLHSGRRTAEGGPANSAKIRWKTVLMRPLKAEHTSTAREGRAKQANLLLGDATRLTEESFLPSRW